VRCGVQVEVVELQTGNGGREFYHFLKRAPLPKSSHQVELGAPLSRAATYTPADLTIGATIEIHGRHFLVHDADDFTKVTSFYPSLRRRCC
jgi:hypothetical protein